LNTLVVILGPTAVGKTALSLQVARHLQTPILNADSRQIYAEMPIGTAAPTPQEQQLVRHYFVGTKHVGDYLNASIYEQEALKTLKQDIFPHQSVALLSGGSMMYIDAVCQGIDDIPTVRDDIRTQLKQRLQDEGLESLLRQLQLLDPEHYNIVDHHNPRRVVHALEICLQTGKTYTSFRTRTPQPRPFRILKIGLNRPREELYDRINRRVESMIDQGLIDEARSLLPYRQENALQTVGYRELFDHFDGLTTLQEAIEKIQSNTRRYMRKQLTWFKRDESIHWFHPDQADDVLRFIDTQLQDNNN